jgi:hypothetical protein
VADIKREFIRKFWSSRGKLEISKGFFTEIHQTDVAQKEFHVPALTIDCNCEEVPINTIICSRTHYY